MKTIDMDGLRFIRDDKTGYYLSNRKSGVNRVRLHRYVWEKHNGPIPKGCHIHHRDSDKSNNDISNLELMGITDHLSLHGSDPKHREMRSENVVKYAVPAAVEWHKSEAGSEWHKEHYEQFKHLLHRTTVKTCEQCGKAYETQDKSNARFCSNNCKSNWRRKAGLDDIERPCVVCGTNYKINRYSKAQTCSSQCTTALKRKNKVDRICR